MLHVPQGNYDACTQGIYEACTPGFLHHGITTKYRGVLRSDLSEKLLHNIMSMLVNVLNKKHHTRFSTSQFSASGDIFTVKSRLG